MDCIRSPFSSNFWAGSMMLWIDPLHPHREDHPLVWRNNRQRTPPPQSASTSTWGTTSPLLLVRSRVSPIPLPAAAPLSSPLCCRWACWICTEPGRLAAPPSTLPDPAASRLPCRCRCTNPGADAALHPRQQAAAEARRQILLLRLIRSGPALFPAFHYYSFFFLPSISASLDLLLQRNATQRNRAVPSSSSRRRRCRRAVAVVQFEKEKKKKLNFSLLSLQRSWTCRRRTRSASRGASARWSCSRSSPPCASSCSPSHHATGQGLPHPPWLVNQPSLLPLLPFITVR